MLLAPKLLFKSTQDVILPQLSGAVAGAALIRHLHPILHSKKSHFLSNGRHHLVWCAVPSTYFCLLLSSLQELEVSYCLALCNWGAMICLEKEMTTNTFQQIFQK